MKSLSYADLAIKIIKCTDEELLEMIEIDPEEYLDIYMPGDDYGMVLFNQIVVMELIKRIFKKVKL
jgi:hypothetical protein